MSNDINEKVDASAYKHEIGHDANEKAGYDKSGAIDAENIEHDMTVMQAVKAYPAASWWAFVMSSTIVSVSSPCEKKQS
jgi:SP family general alpha glucoside:H+ symporter-like MFS transporter